MRLLYFAGSEVPSASANSIHVMRMCEALSSLGHEVTLLAKQGPDGFAEGAADNAAGVFRYYGVEPSFRLLTVAFTQRRQLLGYLRQARQLGAFDALIGRYLYGLWLLRGQGRVFAYESHDAPGRVRALLERQLLADHRCAAHVVISQALKRQYESLFGTQLTARTLVLPDASVDPGPALPIATNSALTAGYAGALYRGRGIELLIELAKGLPGIHFRLAGGTADEVRKLYGAIPDNLHCAGRLPHAAVPEFLAACDVLLAPYQTRIAVAGNSGNTAAWCSPLKLFEYQAQGKAIVCSDLPAMREVLDSEETALLCSPTDADAWTIALRRLDADRPFAQRLGNSARAAFLSQFTWQQRAQRLVDCLEHR